MSVFSYKDAFVRNKGWVTAHEQEVLRRKRVAIAGLGGVGGAHLLTLANGCPAGRAGRACSK